MPNSPGLRAFARAQQARARLPGGDPRDGALARAEAKAWRAIEKPEVRRLQSLGAHSWSHEAGEVAAAGVTAYDFTSRKGRLLRALPSLRRLMINSGAPRDTAL